MMLQLLERIFGASPRVESSPDPELEEAARALAREEMRAERVRDRADRIIERYAPDVHRRSDPADAIRRAQQRRGEA